MPRPSRRVVVALVAVAAAVALGYVALRVGRALWLESQILASGGVLRPRQAAYDVRQIDLAVAIDPARRTIGTRVGTAVEAIAPLAEFEIHLDDRLTVAAVAVDGTSARFRHEDGLIRVALRPPWAVGERHEVEIVSGGKPKIAALPPWIDGFVWATSADGSPWIGVSTQGDGADDWWPAKDHPSDEPDEGYSIELTVPAPLVGLANGRKTDERANADGTVTTRWESDHPINNYLVTVNVGRYLALEERYRGADGTLDLPMTFWVLPEHEQKARALWREAPAILASFARRFGEFPFLDDKIAVVDAPMAGMEHQTLIAYGDDFERDASGIDETLVHELAHEWWGNKISVSDWDDFWIQEGFATYAEALYLEERFGAERAREHLERLREEIENARPLVEGRPRTSAEAYSGDLYNKGAWVLATLRWTIGDEPFFRLVRRFAGERPEDTRLVDSAELARMTAEESGLVLDRFWERYLRQSAPPRFAIERRAIAPELDQLCVDWGDTGFEVPFPLAIDGVLARLEMPGGKGCREVARSATAVPATEGRVLAVPADAG